MHKLLALIIPVTLLGLMLLASCESEKEKIVEVEKVVHDTIAVQIINVSGNDSVAQGGKVTFTADITIPTGYQVGTLVYNWFATGGTFNSATGDTVVWKAPDDAGAYQVSVHVVGENLLVWVCVPWVSECMHHIRHLITWASQPAPGAIPAPIPAGPKLVMPAPGQLCRPAAIRLPTAIPAIP